LVEGFMHALSAFPDGQFDLIFHPVSNYFAPEVLPVWRECFRVLKPGGVLLAGFMSPMIFMFDYAKLEAGVVEVAHALPFSDADLSPSEIELVLANDRTLGFSHSLEEQIGGQLQAGFVLTHMFEDNHPASPLSAYFPMCIATRGVKP
jgi:SAM-dependent methyltransferase